MAVERKKQRRGPGMGPGAKNGGDVFDASPSGTTDISAGGNGKKPGNLQETEAWKKGSSGLKNMWDNYLRFLRSAFARMSREEQETYITRFSQILTIGVSVVALQCFYSILIPQLRVISLPLVVGIAWYLGNKVIAPTMISRFSRYLNPPD